MVITVLLYGKMYEFVPLCAQLISINLIRSIFYLSFNQFIIAKFKTIEYHRTRCDRIPESLVNSSFQFHFLLN